MDQHIVSQVLLRRFGNPAGSATISVIQRDNQVEQPGRVDELAYIPDLVRRHPERLEARWARQVEQRLPEAFSLIEARDLFREPKFVQAIQRCIALHWARSFAMVELIGRVKDMKLGELTEWAVGHQGSAEAALEALTGRRVMAGDAEPRLRLVLRRRLERRLDDEQFVSCQLREHFATAMRKIERRGLEIAEAGAGEFLIADIPTVTWNRKTDRVGVLGGVPWHHSDVLVMPLGPKHAVRLRRTKQEHRYSVLGEEVVRQLNVLQARSALREVYFRPGSGLARFVAKTWSGATDASTN